MAVQRRRERRARILIRSSVIAAGAAVVAVIALVIVSGVAPAGPGPRNMASDGIVIGKGFVAERTPAVAAGANATPTKARESDAVARIRIYSDFLCPNCGAFEKENGDYIADLVESGAATIEHHPIAILDRASRGTSYSTRAANAAAAVADLSPDSYFAVNAALFASQPGEDSPGLSDARLKEIIGGVKGITHVGAIEKAIDDSRFDGWVREVTQRAGENAKTGSDLDRFIGTPTVIVNGKAWDGASQSFKDFVAAALGESETE